MTTEKLLCYLFLDHKNHETFETRRKQFLSFHHNIIQGASLQLSPPYYSSNGVTVEVTHPVHLRNSLGS